MKRIIAFLLTVCLGALYTLSGLSVLGLASDNLTESVTSQEALLEYLEAMRFGEEAELPDMAAPSFNYNVRSAVLMEAETGTVLFNFNAVI